MTSLCGQYLNRGNESDHEVHERMEEIPSDTHFQELLDMGKSIEGC